MSFGFSIGDVWLMMRAISILWSDTRSYSEDSQTLRNEVNTLKYLLGELEKKTCDTKLPPVALELATTQILACSRYINKLDGCLSKRSQNRSRLWWVLRDKMKCLEYKDKCRTSIQDLESIVKMYIPNSVPQGLSIIRYYYRSMLDGIPPANWLCDKPIHLVDALDKSIQFSAEMFSTWEVCISSILSSIYPNIALIHGSHRVFTRFFASDSKIKKVLVG